MRTAAVVFVGLILLSLLFLLISKTTEESGETSFAFITPPPTRTPTPDIQEINKAVCQDEDLVSLEYKDLLRNIEQHTGYAYWFWGTVAQVVPKSSDGYDYLITITRVEGSFWLDPIFVSIDQHSAIDTRFLERDLIMFCGIPVGLMRYETVRGDTAEVPHVLVLHIFSHMECDGGGSCFPVRN